MDAMKKKEFISIGFVLHEGYRQKKRESKKQSHRLAILLAGHKNSLEAFVPTSRFLGIMGSDRRPEESKRHALYKLRQEKVRSASIDSRCQAIIGTGRPSCRGRRCTRSSTCPSGGCRPCSRRGTRSRRSPPPWGSAPCSCRPGRSCTAAPRPWTTRTSTWGRRRCRRARRCRWRSSPRSRRRPSPRSRPYRTRRSEEERRERQER